MGTWGGIYEGGDLEAVVRGSTPASYSKFTLQQATCVSATTEHSQSGDYSSFKKHEALKNDDKIMPTDTKLEPASPEIIPGVESSPPPSVSLNSPSRSRAGHGTGLHNSAAMKLVNRSSSAIKTESNCLGFTKGLKRRKSEERRVMCVPMAEGSWNKQGGAGVSSDLWSWRKYGQKPIKGSPYPRGYYRCSSSKGCPARKQIERSRTDPTTLLITYTADHNHVWPAHRNALARSSRQVLLHDKQVSNTNSDVVVPSCKDSDDGVSPLSDKWGPHSHFPTNSVDEEYQHVGFDHHNLFADLGELYLNHSGEEDAAATMVDPFNLFDWSFSANEMPNS